MPPLEFEELYGKHELPLTEYLVPHILALTMHYGLSEFGIEKISISD
jgi:hypothetical protein